MKRRAFLGLFGGAVAAGPKVAAKLASDLAGANAAFFPPPGLVSGGLNASGGPDSGWRLTRIGQLKALLSGVKSDEDKRQQKINRLHQAEMEERFRLDGLRSPSATAKARMLVAGNQERSERINRLYAENELENLLKFI